MSPRTLALLDAVLDAVYDLDCEDRDIQSEQSHTPVPLRIIHGVPTWQGAPWCDWHTSEPDGWWHHRQATEEEIINALADALLGEVSKRRSEAPFTALGHAVAKVVPTALLDQPERGDRTEKGRGTPSHPCEECGQTTEGHFVERGFQRCNSCGYPGQ